MSNYPNMSYCMIENTTRAMAQIVDALAEVGSHLLVAGVGDRVLTQMTRTGARTRIGTDNVFAATPRVGESLAAALARAETLRARA